MTNREEEVLQLQIWANDELACGNRVKAGIINRAAQRMLQKQREWDEACYRAASQEMWY